MTPGGIEFVRTPHERFADLPDFPHEPAYVDIDGLRMAYIDVGPIDGPTVLLLHGEPTWSFLYRRMITPLIEAGFRCVAPDLIGFGRSDKPTDRSAYTYNGHVSWVTSFLEGGVEGLREVDKTVPHTLVPGAPSSATCTPNSSSAYPVLQSSLPRNSLPVDTSCRTTEARTSLQPLSRG